MATRQGPGRQDRPAFEERWYYLPGDLNRLDLDRDRRRRFNRLFPLSLSAGRIEHDREPLEGLVRLAHPQAIRREFQRLKADKITFRRFSQAFQQLSDF